MHVEFFFFDIVWIIETLLYYRLFSYRLITKLLVIITNNILRDNVLYFVTSLIIE